jgi:hypothetical protein
MGRSHLDDVGVMETTIRLRGGVLNKAPSLERPRDWRYATARPRRLLSIEIRDHAAGVNRQRSGHVEELHDIEAALAPLELRDE